MKIKLDENLPCKLAIMLSKLGHDVETVPQENLQGQLDFKIWEVAQKEKRFFITQDLDFSNINVFTPGTHSGLMLIRLRDPGIHTLKKRIEAIFKSENIETWKNAFIVVTDHKIRVRKPAS